MSKRAAPGALRRTPVKFGGVEPVVDEPTKRLTIDIPESLHTRIKVACARNKLKMNTMVMEGLNRVLAQYE
jgi:predicted HicB family RNase H-like nuclease